jgi:hypothetical protein
MIVFLKINIFDILSNKTLCIYENKEYILPLDAPFNFTQTLLTTFFVYRQFYP